MSRSKLGLLGLCVIALSLMAFAVSSASAAEWLILTKAGTVKTAKELPVSVVSELEPKTAGGLKGKVLGLGFIILCTFIGHHHSKFEGGGKISSGTQISFSGCTVVEEPSGKPLGNCTVSNPGGTAGTIESNELKGQLQTNGEILIEPNKTVVEGTKTVGVFAELKFAGNECPFTALGTTPIKGVLWLKDCEGKAETHLVKHLIVASTAHGHTLWLGADNAEHLETEFRGSLLLYLAAEHEGLAWGDVLP